MRLLKYYMFACLSLLLLQSLSIAQNEHPDHNTINTFHKDTKENQQNQTDDSMVGNTTAIDDTNRVLQNLVDGLISDKSLKSSLSISGFTDLNYFTGNGEKSELNYGQFEVDFSASLYEQLSFEAALALDGESVVPGAGYLDYHFSGPEEGHDARGSFFSHSGIHVGQFDVPFGKYYEQIPSPSRNVSTIPFVIQNSINCLNTFGVNVYTNYSIAEANVFALNGIRNGYILGGRLGLNFFDFITVGSSILNSFDKDYDNTTLLGVDVSLKSPVIMLNSELIWGDGIADCDYDGINSKHFGYYVESIFLTSNLVKLPVNLILRYGSWKSEKNLTDRLNNISHFDVTLDWLIHERLTLKFEHHNYLSDGLSYLSNVGLQAVISF